MVKYIGPRLKIIRRLGLLPGLSSKFAKIRLKSPGQHGRFLAKKTTRASLSDDYKERLIEKQKLRFNYGITEKQLRSYYKMAKKKKYSTGSALLELLESRLDCIVFRLGFASTIPAARQLINHGHVLVNDRTVSIPSFTCYRHDVISAKASLRSQKIISQNLKKESDKKKLIRKRMKRVNLVKSRFKNLVPRHLILDRKKLKGEFIRRIKRKDILIKVKDLKIVEYYSR